MCVSFILLFLFTNKCDVMGQNQSHVAKQKRVNICILSENVKVCQFFGFIKNKIFVKVSANKIDFLTFLLDLSCIFQILRKSIYR